MDAATRRYVIGWALLGAASIVAVALLTGIQRPDLRLVGALLVTAVVAERVQLTFPFPHATASFTLIEVAITASLLLVDPIEAVAIATLGTAGGHLTRRSDLGKIGFGAGQAAVGMSAAALTLHLLPAFGPDVAGRSVVPAVLGMCLYVAVNLVSILGLLRRLGGDEAVAGVRTQIPLTSATMVGQIATGVVLAALAVLDLWLVPFVVAPAAAVHLAAKGATRTAHLLTQVRSERDRLNRIVDGTSDGILLLDGQARIQVWNPAMERLTGISAASAMERPIAEVLSDRIREADQPVRGRWVLEKAHDTPPRHELHAVLRHVGGGTRAVRESHTLVFDERGRCTGDVVVLHDVTRQRELDRLRSDFVARVSHELRTPLTPIRGFTSLLLRRIDTISSDQRDQALQSILERTDHLSELVEDLLLVTQLDRGEVDRVVRVRPTDLHAVVAPAVAAARKRAPSRSITYAGAPGTGPALADAARLAKVMEALLDNACRYSPEGSPVEVELTEQGDDLCIRVADHGQGIPREHHELVFERFSRLEDPLTMRTGGVGLGLFLARQLVTAMQGSLELVPQPPGAGAVLEIRLPNATTDSQGSASGTGRTAGNDPDPALGPRGQ